MKQKFLAAVFILSAFAVNAQSGTTKKSKKTTSMEQSTSVTKDSAQLGGEGTSDTNTMQSKHKSTKWGKGTKMKSKTSTSTTSSADSTK